MSSFLQNRRKSFREENKLLDRFPGAAAAYSLREITDLWRDQAVVEVRRSSGTPTTATFTASDITDGTLTTWVGAGNDGFVRTWYDQSGNAFDITQTSTSLQPQIVDNGSLITTGGLPAMQLDGTDDYLANAGSIPYSGGVSWYSVTELISLSTSERLWCDDITGVQGYNIFYLNGPGFSLNDNGTGYKTITHPDFGLVHQLNSFCFDDATGDYCHAQDGLTTTGTISPWTGPLGTSGSANVGVGSAGNGAQYMHGNLQELIIYPDYQLSNRAIVEENINDYYSIFFVSDGRPVLDQFAGAAAAYSLRVLTNSWTNNNVIRVRRSDNAELDFTATQVSDGTLTSWVVAGGGAQDGFVKTWYDQSGNSLDLTAPATSNEPQIVSSGSLIVSNGEPAVDFNGTSHYLNILNTNIPYNGGVSWYAVTDLDTVTANERIWCDDITGVQGYTVAYVSSPGFSVNDNGTGYKDISRVAPVSTSQAVNSFNFNDSTGAYDQAENGVNTAGTVAGWTGPIDTPNTAYIGVGGAGNGGQYMDGKLQELIIYPNDQRSGRLGITTLINNHYNIFT